MDKQPLSFTKAAAETNLTEIHVTTLSSLFWLIVFKVILWKLLLKNF